MSPTAILWTKRAVFVCLAVPTVQMAWIAVSPQGVGTRADTIVILSGGWSMWLLVAVLCIRPAREVFGFAPLLRFRRMIGLYAAWYAALHTAAYIADKGYDWGLVANEIFVRPSLTIGAAAVVALVPLVATSTDAMLRRLGGLNWRRLQSLVYPILVLAVLHYVMSTRDNNPYVPVIQAGLVGWLLHYRLLVFLRRRRGVSPRIAGASLIVLGLLWGVGTGAIEILYFQVNTSINLMRVLSANFGLSAGVRPAQIVAAVSIATALVKAGQYLISVRRKDRELP